MLRIKNTARLITKKFAVAIKVNARNPSDSPQNVLKTAEKRVKIKEKRAEKREKNVEKRQKIRKKRKKRALLRAALVRLVTHVIS